MYSDLSKFTPVSWPLRLAPSARVHCNRWWRDCWQQHRHAAAKYQPWRWRPAPRERSALWTAKYRALQSNNSKEKHQRKFPPNSSRPSRCRVIATTTILPYSELVLCLQKDFDLRTCRSGGEVAQIQSAIEHFVAEAHERQNVFLVVEPHDEILIRIEEFVRGFALHRRPAIHEKKTKQTKNRVKICRLSSVDKGKLD